MMVALNRMREEDDMVIDQSKELRRTVYTDKVNSICVPCGRLENNENCKSSLKNREYRILGLILKMLVRFA